MNHRLNAYKDNNIWITYCEKCSKEADKLLGSNCAGQVEAVIFKCKYPNCDGGSATGYCRTECWQEPTANKNRLGDSSSWINNANFKFDELFPIKT